MEGWEHQEPVLIYDRIEANRRNTFLLLAIFTVVWLPFAIYVTHYVMGLLAVFILPLLFGWEQVTGNPAFIITLSGIWALFIAFLVTYLVYIYSSRLVLRISNATPLKDGEAVRLRRIVENLCIGSGLPQPSLAVINSTAINAFSTGLDPHHASLVVTQGLLDALDRQELEGVVAQELSQIGNHDTRLNTIVAAMVTTMWLPLSILKALTNAFLERFYRRRSAGCLAGGVLLLLWFGLPMILGIIIIFAALVGLLFKDFFFGVFLWAIVLFPIAAPFVALFIHRAASREREFRADADAALLTRYPAGLAQALAKIGIANNAKMRVNPATANLYTVNPLSGENQFWSRLLSSHPPIEERIERLARMGGVTPTMIQKAREEGLTFRQTVLEGLSPVSAQ